MARRKIDPDILARAQALVDRKYVARADERQRSMGLAYVEAERQDLAREIATFADGETVLVVNTLLEMTGEI